MIPMRLRAAPAAVLLAIALACARGGAQPRRAQHEVSACGLRFQVPAHWQLRSRPAYDLEACAAELLPDSVAQARDSIYYLVSVARMKTGFAESAELASFERRANGWVTVGRMGMVGPAQPISRGGLHGVKGTVTFGLFDEHGYAGLAEGSRAVVCRGERCLVLDAAPQADDAFDLILASVRFSAR